jgi:hypothetical protein
MRVRWVVAVLVAALATGCGGDDDTAEEPTASLGETEWVTDGAGVDQDASSADDGVSGTAGGGTGDAVLEPAGAFSVPDARKVIRSAELDLVVERPDRAADAIVAAVERAGGFVADADLARGEDQLLTGTIVVRAPAQRLTGLLADIEDLAVEVRSKRIGSDDVTGEYTDVEAQLTNLRAVETELRAMLEETRARPGATPDQVLSVFERVNSVRSEIDRLEGRRRVLADLVDLATITVHLTAAAPLPTSSTPEPGWSPVGVVRDAAGATAAALRGVADVAIWIGVFAIPLAVVLGAPLAGLVWVVRRTRRATI